MALPLVDEVRAARLLLEEAQAAHAHAHALASALDEGGQPLDALLADEIAERWGLEVGEPDTWQAAHDALVPLAASEHDREHALERLLFEQWTAMQERPDLAPIRAVLDPVFDERAQIYSWLVPLIHQHTLLPHARLLLAQFLAPLGQGLESARGPDDGGGLARGALQIAEAAATTLAEVLPKLGIAHVAPELPAVSSEDEQATGPALRDAASILERALRSLDAALAADEAAMATRIAAGRARWDELQALILAHTG